MAPKKRKICLIGDFAVGKTSLIRRYVDRQFSDQYLSTVGVKISKKQIALPPQKGHPAVQFELLIWDLEGRTKFEAIAPSYLRGAGGAIVVGALDREDTLSSLDSHVQVFLSINPAQPVIIALNKADLVPPQQQQALLAKARASITPDTIGYEITSAKTGNSVDSLFETLVHAL